MKWDVSVRNQHRTIKVSSGKVKKIMVRVLGELRLGGLRKDLFQVSVLFVNDATIHKLNRKFRGKNKPTDVLSFPQVENLRGKLFSPSLGDIVISLDTAKTQAKEFGVSLYEELLRLLIHGTLHLAGYDHEKVSASKAQKMRRTEAKLFRAIYSK